MSRTSQALHTDGDSTKPAISAGITTSCDVNGNAVSSAGQLLIPAT